MTALPVWPRGPLVLAVVGLAVLAWRPAADTAVQGPVRLEGDWWEETRAVFGGTPARVLVQVPAGAAATPAQVVAEAWQALAQVDLVFNAFDPESEVSRLGASRKTGPVLVSSPFMALLRECQVAFVASGGAFDPTVWPLKALWREAVRRQTPPTDGEVAAARAHVGMGKVHLAPPPGNTVTFDDPGVQFDLGGVVKGWAVDRAREVVVRLGATAGLISCGGEVSSFGARPGRPWRVAVQHPRAPAEAWGVLEDAAPMRCSTSGNYHRPLRVGARTYFHIFDPRTGWPVRDEIESVTVLGGEEVSNALLDATSTAVAVLGPGPGLQLARDLGMEAMVLVRRGGQLEEVTTDGWGRRFQRAGP
jgi:thiamine biosynthesis lipoprotein